MLLKYVINLDYSRLLKKKVVSLPFFVYVVLLFPSVMIVCYMGTYEFADKYVEDVLG